MMRPTALRALVGALLAGVIVGLPGSAMALADSETLPPGVAVTRELAAGQTHVFQFALDAGEFLEADVQQQGVDVTVTLAEPDGVAILEVDGTEDPMRIERVLWIGRAAGTHSLSIRAKLDRPGGRYTGRYPHLGWAGHISCWAIPGAVSSPSRRLSACRVRRRTNGRSRSI